MTIEIRELIVQVQVTEYEQPGSATACPASDSWYEQRLLEKLKREILEHLLERGQL